MTSITQTLAARSLPGRLAFGFIAGAIAVVIAHQVMVLILYLTGYIPNPPYSFRANPTGVPQTISNMFWGGLWGVLYALIVQAVPRGWPTWMKGLVFGLGVHVILGNWIVLALIRGLATFGGWAPPRMLLGALIGTSFGLGVAYVYAALTGRQGS